MNSRLPTERRQTDRQAGSCHSSRDSRPLCRHGVVGPSGSVLSPHCDKTPVVTGTERGKVCWSFGVQSRQRSRPRPGHLTAARSQGEKGSSHGAKIPRWSPALASLSPCIAPTWFSTQSKPPVFVKRLSLGPGAGPCEVRSWASLLSLDPLRPPWTPTLIGAGDAQASVSPALEWGHGQCPLGLLSRKERGPRSSRRGTRPASPALGESRERGRRPAVTCSQLCSARTGLQCVCPPTQRGPRKIQLVQPWASRAAESPPPLLFCPKVCGGRGRPRSTTVGTDEDPVLPSGSAEEGEGERDGHGCCLGRQQRGGSASALPWWHYIVVKTDVTENPPLSPDTARSPHTIQARFLQKRPRSPSTMAPSPFPPRLCESGHPRVRGGGHTLFTLWGPAYPTLRVAWSLFHTVGVTVASLFKAAYYSTAWLCQVWLPFSR
jgi:hypothetical protein